VPRRMSRGATSDVGIVSYPLNGWSVRSNGTCP
jgi:hypothetical protein